MCFMVSLSGQTPAAPRGSATSADGLNCGFVSAITREFPYDSMAIAASALYRDQPAESLAGCYRWDFRDIWSNSPWHASAPCHGSGRCGASNVAFGRLNLAVYLGAVKAAFLAVVLLFSNHGALADGRSLKTEAQQFQRWLWPHQRRAPVPVTAERPQEPQLPPVVAVPGGPPPVAALPSPEPIPDPPKPAVIEPAAEVRPPPPPRRPRSHPVKTRPERKPTSSECSQIVLGMSWVGREGVFAEAKKRGYSRSQTQKAITACGL